MASWSFHGGSLEGQKRGSPLQSGVLQEMVLRLSLSFFRRWMAAACSYHSQLLFSKDLGNMSGGYNQNAKGAKDLFLASIHNGSTSKN